MRRGRVVLLSLGALALTLSVPTASLQALPLDVHLALSASSPGVGDELEAAPDAVRLFFTEPVEIGLSAIELSGPAGAVALGPLEIADSPGSLQSVIRGGLVAGSYTVRWRAVGRDGHPVRGEFSFTLIEGAQGLETVDSVGVDTIPARTPGVPPADPSVGSDRATAEQPGSVFSSESPLYAAVRWFGYLAILGIVGAIGFAGLFLSPRLANGAVSAGFRRAATAGAAGLGIVAAAGLLVTLPLRLQAQSHAIFGTGIAADRFARILESQWGLGWAFQFGGCLMALGGLLLARRGSRAGWVLAVAGAIGVALGPGLGGHAAAVRSISALAVLSDALHLLAAGLWLGTLLAVLTVGLPISRTLRAPERARTVFELVHAYSPLALVAATIVVVTGGFAAFLHLTTPSDLLLTVYGRFLLAKLSAVAVVIGAGAFNWRRIRPHLADDSTAQRLHRSASIELAAAAAVVGITAFLVAVPPPAGSAAPAVQAAAESAAP
ncbi:MAG: copper resistance protein CopC [Gemmatimonadota bacterium]